LHFDDNFCNTLHHPASHCNTLQHTAVVDALVLPSKVNTLLCSDRCSRHITHYNALQYTATLSTHCNTLQHTATHCHTLQHTAAHCNTLQHTATHCITLQHTASHCNTLQLTATHCNSLQLTATHYRWQMLWRCRLRTIHLIYCGRWSQESICPIRRSGWLNANASSNLVVSMCCSVLQGVAVCLCWLQCFRGNRGNTECKRVLKPAAFDVLQVAVLCCSVLQCNAVCCRHG